MGPSASAAQLGFIGLLQFLPLFFLTPAVGWVADHMNRRDVARATVGLQFLCTATLAAFTWYDAMTLPVLFSVAVRSEEHTSELQSLMRNSYAVFGLKKK